MIGPGHPSLNLNLNLNAPILLGYDHDHRDCHDQVTVLVRDGPRRDRDRDVVVPADIGKIPIISLSQPEVSQYRVNHDTRRITRARYRVHQEFDIIIKITKLQVES